MDNTCDVHDLESNSILIDKSKIFFLFSFSLMRDLDSFVIDYRNHGTKHKTPNACDSNQCGHHPKYVFSQW